VTKTKLGPGQACRLALTGRRDRRDLTGEPITLRAEPEGAPGRAEVVDLREQRPGRVGISKHDVGLRELEPGLDSEPGEGAGERGRECGRAGEGND